MRKLNRDDVLHLVEEWKNEKDPADAWRYADVMAQILKAWEPHIPTNLEVAIDR